eukprot:TRINITY_DN35449_c0_g2_i1.p1 TRINITY_DN35449_c0_g2~~TRINITY_DN35449_c0_g2_i1.p1  ORF type:complete len:391 (-),score=68.27 TRINITY_DN35449_c0_g2_i1:323-1405(-)
MPAMRYAGTLAEARTCECGTVVMVDGVHCRKCGVKYEDHQRKLRSTCPATIMQTYLFNPEVARKQSAKAIEEAKEETERWKNTCRRLEEERDSMEEQLHRVELEAHRKVTDLEWTSVKQATEYEDQIASLKDLLEKEREAHVLEHENWTRLANDAHEAAEARVREAEQRHKTALASANSRALEAEERAEFVMRRADVELAAQHLREGQRVEVVARDAEMRVRESEEQKIFELAQIHSSVLERQRAAEKTMFVNGRQKSEAVSEVQRHAAQLELGMKELLVACDTKGMRDPGQRFELDKMLHQRTADRNVSRMARAQHQPEHQRVDWPTSARLPATNSVVKGSPLARAGALRTIGVSTSVH